jgi:hypothetical protein
LILAALAAFIAGGVLVGYVMWYNFQPDRNGSPRTAASVADAPGATPTSGPSALLTGGPTPLAQTIRAEQAEQAVERVEEQQGGLDQRLAAAEQRLTQLDLQAQAAAGNAARAESLLIAFATRRAVERGAELGYLSDQLRLRFGRAGATARSKQRWAFMGRVPARAGPIVRVPARKHALTAAAAAVGARALGA